ncbi:MAG: vanadium-dependent haloperoxidase, partial [Cyanobacteria bacterium J06626_14]
PFTDRVRHGAKFAVINNTVQPVPNPSATFRQWEAPTAGVVYELEGPDAQAVTMAPAPDLLDACGANPELVLEMAEVYELAVLRDQPLNDFEAGCTNHKIQESLGRLNALSYISNQTRRPRKVNCTTGQLDFQTVFRGSSPGVEIGPYLSQFLLLGSLDRNGGGNVAQGQITYGVLQIDQKVPIAEPGVNYIMTMGEYVDVQRGIDPPNETYGATNGSPVVAPARPPRRFISTPRDLATYVHYDELYEAYLNACLILLGMGTPFDTGFDHLSGKGEASSNGATRRNAGGFALYGGPHILTLVTEVATRALKAVRFQKFNNHIRLRPEALAARVELIRRANLPVGDPDALPASTFVPPTLVSDVGSFSQELDTIGTLGAIATLTGNGSNFLPMAFPEGSPMHPAYGAGHATVAGACVTILKAFFDTSAVLVSTPTGGVFKRFKPGDTPVVFRAPALPDPMNGGGAPNSDLVADTNPGCFLTLEGELNKLAANISIGRNMAGVHYFSDYYDSLRMGEEIAIGILEEQALTYLTDPFVLSVPTFDGDIVRIGNR